MPDGFGQGTMQAVTSEPVAIRLRQITALGGKSYEVRFESPGMSSEIVPVCEIGDAISSSCTHPGSSMTRRMPSGVGDIAHSIGGWLGM